MLFQCGRLEGLHLPYVSLVRATGVGRLSGGGRGWCCGRGSHGLLGIRKAIKRRTNPHDGKGYEGNRSRYPTIEFF